MWTWGIYAGREIGKGKAEWRTNAKHCPPLNHCEDKHFYKPYWSNHIYHYSSFWLYTYTPLGHMMCRIIIHFWTNKLRKSISLSLSPTLSLSFLPSFPLSLHLSVSLWQKIILNSIVQGHDSFNMDYFKQLKYWHPVWEIIKKLLKKCNL